MSYYEGNDKFISVYEKQQGSTANLGIYPHWCIANLNKCNNGLTLSFWFKPNPAPDNSSTVTILTTGGHLFYSEGIYFIQKYGDQYEFGVAKSNYIWNTKFRLVPSFWTHLILYWDEKVGIKIFVDEKLLEIDTPKTRKYIQQSFDSFSEIIIGIDEYEKPINSRNLFEIQDILIYNRIVDKDLIPLDETFVYRGCILDDNNIGQDSGGFRLVNSTVSMKECRENCSEMGYQVFQFKEGIDCVCFMREKLSTLSKGAVCSSDKPKFFTASNSDDKNPYNLTVTVEKLQVRNYVKPFETVNIHIHTNIKSKIIFHVDFGDGISLSTMEKEVSHFWNSQGNFTITVMSTLGIFQVRGITTFEISDVDEGVKPEMVLISGIHKQSSALTGDFEIVTVDREETNCTVDFFDGSSLHRDIYKTHYAETRFINHTFPAFGGYPISAKCQNVYGLTSNETFFISKKFEIPFLYYPKGSNFSIDVAGSYEYVAKQTEIFRNYENTSLSTTFHGNTIIISEKDFQNFENLITLKSHGEDVMQRIFFVEKILGQPSIFVDTKNSAWNLTTNITVIIPDGNHIFINCSFGVGDDRLFYITESDDSTRLVFEIQYDGLGYYPLQIVISNDLSYETVDSLISVEVPLETIQIITSNITDKTLPVKLTIDLNAGKRGPDKVKFRIDHDDGNTITYAYRSHTDTFTKYENNYVYRDWGIYYICVTAYNEISSVQACTLVQVGQNITYIDVQTNTNARVTTIEYAEVNVTTISGSDLTYLVDFGDGYPFVFTDRQLKASAIVPSSDTVSTAPITFTEFLEEFVENNSTAIDSSGNGTINGSLSRSKRDTAADSDPRSKATRLSETVIKVYHIFTKPGKYSVKVRISNAFSAKWTYLCTAIFVDNVDISQCTQPAISFRGIQSSLENPITRVRSLDIPIIVDATSNCGTTFTYAWKGIKYIDNLQVPVDSLCENDNNGAEFRIPAVTLTFGLYRLTVTVAPYGYRRNAVQKDVFLRVVASRPYAEFAGKKEDWVLIYQSTTLDVSPSRDPDFGNRQGLTYDLFCCLKQEFDIIDQMDLETLRTTATPVYDDVTYKRETNNNVTLYQYGQCFEVEDNSTDEFTAVKGQVNFPTEFFIESATDFSFKLFVSKEGRINSTFKHLEVRLTNASSLDDLVNNLDNIKDAAGMIRAVSSITKNMESTNVSRFCSIYTLGIMFIII
ncbi:hypothetical protein KUTeg_007094 [Tegillarca granosa]|uniref:PKD domain-containing protein n=1 Tax=Tegillarca granosa TaxID=220873 RepID=A0ABQ9FC98_TEGGR|nr:hypothetical protein KUTeg_007094 [Tegillarca granosa]